MFVRCSAFIRKYAPSAGIAALLFIARSSASGEPIQFSKPDQKPDATQEKKSILSYRAYRPATSISGTPSISENLPAPVAPAPVAPSSRTSRQNQELLDRQKNWIFVTPEDEKKADSAKDIFGTDNIMFDDEKSKSVITKFLENKRAKDTKTGVNAKDDKDQKRGFGDPETFGLGNEKQNQSGNSLQQDSFEKKFNEPGTRELSLSGLWKEQNGPRADKMREEKQIQMNEFRSLFTSGGVPTSSANNFGLQSASPLSGGGSSFNPNPVAFKLPDTGREMPRIGGGAVASAPPSINARVFGQSAAPAPAPEPSRLAPQPSVLPIPKRHF